MFRNLPKVYFVLSLTTLCCHLGFLTNASAQNVYPSGASCIEHWLTAEMRGDYGKALNSAVAAQSLTQPSILRSCSSGDHEVSTPIVIDRPISLWMYGTRLIPTKSLASASVAILGANISSGKREIFAQNTSELRVGMAIGGLGIGSTNYITAINLATHTITLALPPRLLFNGLLRRKQNGICGVSSMQGLAKNAVIFVGPEKNREVISELDYSAQCLRLVNPPKIDSTTPVTVEASGSWDADLTAISTQPVILWKKNSSALKNSEGQNIGGEMHGVWIADPAISKKGIGRSLPGVIGVQIAGWDRFRSEDLVVENLIGSALILGGTGTREQTDYPIRESSFSRTDLRDSGDPLTGQSSLEIMSPPQREREFDEINQISFISGSIVFNYAEAITIGTYNNKHIASNGPRLLWFADNFQIEGGSHVPAENTQSPFDIIHIITAGDIYFLGCELAVPGYGKAVVRSDYTKDTLAVIGSRIYARGKRVTYSVAVKEGDPRITYISGGNGAFNDSGILDGSAAQVVGGDKCKPEKPCNVYLSPKRTVSAGGKFLTLAEPLRGSGSISAQLTLGFDGYFFNNTGHWDSLVAIGNTWTDPSAAGLSLLGNIAPKDAISVGNPISFITLDHHHATKFTIPIKAPRYPN